MSRPLSVPRPPRKLPRVVCLVGPTSSGKTDLGLRLAKAFNGEIINADSRQIYKGFDIGTGKPRGKRGSFDGQRAFMVEGVPHYMMDFLDPLKTFTVAEWRDKTLVAIRGIIRRKRLPIVVGGTGLYIKSLVDNLLFPHVEPQPAMRKAFEGRPLEELVRLLLGLDSDAAQAVDLKNPRRVIRALEVATLTGKPFCATQAPKSSQLPKWPVRTITPRPRPKAERSLSTPCASTRVLMPAARMRGSRMASTAITPKWRQTAPARASICAGLFSEP